MEKINHFKMVKAVCVIAGDIKGNVYFEQVKWPIENLKPKSFISFATNFFDSQKRAIVVGGAL